MPNLTFWDLCYGFKFKIWTFLLLSCQVETAIGIDHSLVTIQNRTDKIINVLWYRSLFVIISNRKSIL